MSGKAGGSSRDANLAATPSPGEAFSKKLKPLVGKRVESVSVDDLGIVYITAAGFGGRIVVKIGEPRYAR